MDEELFAPLVGHMADVVDGRIVVWMSGANFEDNRRPRTFSPEQARRDLMFCLLRAKDRLSPDFADAPPVAADHPGRAGSLGRLCLGPGPTPRDAGPAAGDDLRVPPAARLHRCRRRRVRAPLGDAVHHVCRLQEICAETGASTRDSSKIPIDLLRQK